MRPWPWASLLALLAIPGSTACSMSADVEGHWGLWSTASGQLEVVESPMFSHGTACEPYPPGHALDGDLFVWAEPVWGRDNATRVHVRKGGTDIAVWPVPTQPWRDVAHLGVADGIAYLVWDTRGNESVPPIGRLDLGDGGYTELANPYPDTATYWLSLSSSVLWTTGPRFSDIEEGVWAFDLATGRDVVRNLTGSSLGIAGHVVWPLHGSLGHGWTVFAVQEAPGLEAKVSYRGYEVATGRLLAFDLPDFPAASVGGGSSFYAWIDRELHRVDFSGPAARVAVVPWPEVGDERWGPQGVASASGDRVVLAWFDSHEVDAGGSSRPAGGVEAGLLVLAVAAVAARRR